MTLEHNEHIRDGIRKYCRWAMLAAPIEGHNARVDAEEGSKIAQAYEQLETLELSARLAYHMLAIEIERQYELAVFVLGIRFEFTESDPYANSAEMCADVRDNKRLRVYCGESNHPYLTSEQNCHFRAIHDLYGHAAEGYSFGPRGEHNAWLHHSMMFTPLAQRALTTETRGQNSWVNYGPYAELPASERPFAEQKCALLPVEYSNWRKCLEEN